MGLQEGFLPNVLHAVDLLGYLMVWCHLGSRLACSLHQQEGLGGRVTYAFIADDLVLGDQLVCSSPGKTLPLSAFSSSACNSLGRGEIL